MSDQTPPAPPPPDRSPGSEGDRNGFSALAAAVRGVLDHPAARWIERAVYLAILVFLLARLGPQISALTGVGASPAGAPGSRPDFTVATLDGDTIRSEALRGRVVVVNFWATWCPPCRFEMPSLQALHEAHDPGELVVLGLSTDAGSVRPVRRFLKEKGISYPVARAHRRVERAFGGVTGIPTTVILDREGRVRHRVVGYFVPLAMKSAVRRILAEGPEVGGR